MATNVSSDVSSAVHTSSTGKREWTSTLQPKRPKRQVSKETFFKWQQTYEREHLSTVWLRADIDDKDKSPVSTLWCVVCRNYEGKICGHKNFSKA